MVDGNVVSALDGELRFDPANLMRASRDFNSFTKQLRSDLHF
jgi:hypothetical protein